MATPAPTIPMTAAAPSAIRRLRLRSAACLSGLNSSCVRRPASVNTPAAKRPESCPGSASASASRNDREISRRVG